MGRRLEDGSWKDSSLDKLNHGEPFFVLRAQDKTAPIIVRKWIEWARAAGAPGRKLQEAAETAEAMEKWDGLKKIPD